MLNFKKLGLINKNICFCEGKREGKKRKEESKIASTQSGTEWDASGGL